MFPSEFFTVKVIILPDPTTGVEDTGDAAAVCAGMTVPVPWMLKVYGFSSLSSFAMLIDAERTPSAVGSKVTLYVALPDAGTVLSGICVIVKSAVSPDIMTYGDEFKRCSGEVPMLLIVKVLSTEPVLTSTLPKSV